MGNARSARRTGCVADTACAGGTYTSLQQQEQQLHHQHQPVAQRGGLSVTFDDQIRHECRETAATASLRSSLSWIFKHGPKRSSWGSSSVHVREARVETWPVSQTETLFLPLFPTQARHRTKELTLTGDLADGAFGKVCKVDAHDSRETYAIKIISKSKVIRKHLVCCILQELEILKAVGHHPFIVQFVENWQTRRKLFILTEFVPRGELYALLQKHVICPLLIVQLYVAQLALVLDFLHNAGVIYRDLKPENLLLDEQFNLKVIDFGFSKWLAYGARTQTVCGTPKYMAPEIWTGEPYGHSVDWWSMGVVACRMLTGQFIRLEPNPSPVSKPEKVHLPSSVELDMPSKDLLMRLLQLDSSKRLKTLRTLQQIRFYYKFNFDDVRNKRLVGLEVWKRFHPNFLADLNDSSDTDILDS